MKDFEDLGSLSEEVPKSELFALPGGDGYGVGVVVGVDLADLGVLGEGKGYI